MVDRQTLSQSVILQFASACPGINNVYTVRTEYSFGCLVFRFYVGRFTDMAISNKAPCYLLILIVDLQLISAFAQVTRRDDTSVWDPFWEDIINGVGGAGSSALDDVFQRLLPELPALPTPEPADPLYPESPTSAGAQTDPLDLPFSRPLTDENCNRQPVGAPDDQCDRGTRKLIFARDCTNQIQNAAIAGILAQTIESGEISTTIYHGCGVIFWTGELSEEGVEIMRSTDGVLAVVSDVILETSEFYTLKPGESENLTDRGSSLQKRDHLVTQPLDTTIQDLIFISTPPGTDTGIYYTYFSAAGEGITVYLVDSGVNPSNNEFNSGVIKRWLYAWDVLAVESDDHPLGHGSCAASKITGVDYGVAKKASLIIVKINTKWLSSGLDGLVLILNDLRRRKKEGEYIPGYNVVSMQSALKNSLADRYSTDTFKYLISELINQYGIILVCAAGNGGGKIDSIPPTFSPKMPIIVVGAVSPHTGATLPFSNRGPPLTVSAPGQVFCAGRGAGRNSQTVSGSSFAAPAVAGLVAYFLSLHDVGPMLRRKPNMIPQVVKHYVVDSAYVRPLGTDKAIWNNIASEP